MAGPCLGVGYSRGLGFRVWGLGFRGLQAEDVGNYKDYRSYIGDIGNILGLYWYSGK